MLAALSSSMLFLVHKGQGFFLFIELFLQIFQLAVLLGQAAVLRQGNGYGQSLDAVAVSGGVALGHLLEEKALHPFLGAFVRCPRLRVAVRVFVGSGLLGFDPGGAFFGVVHGFLLFSGAVKTSRQLSTTVFAMSSLFSRAARIFSSMLPSTTRCM